jgi:hypothetical protein
VVDSPWLNPSAAMAARCQPASPSQLERIWCEVVEQVRAEGLALGVHVEAPEKTSARTIAMPAPALSARPGSC